jgi:hypothetical protein
MKIRIKVPTQLAESLEEKAKKAVEEAQNAVAEAKKEKQLKQLEELKAKVDDKIAMLKGKKGKKQKVEEMYGAKDMEEMSDTNVDEAFDPTAVTDILGVLAGIGGIAGTGVAITKWQDKIKAKNPDLYNKLAQIGKTIRSADPSKDLGPNEEKINEMVDPATSWEAVAAGMAAIGLAPLVINKMHDWWKKKSPGSYKKAQGISAAMDRSVGGNQPGEKAGQVNPNKTFGPNE